MEEHSHINKEMNNASNSKGQEKRIKQIVTFSLANEKYGIDIMQTQEIIKIVKMIPIPNSLDFVEGVINLRGNVIPIIDLKKRFNLMGGEEKSKGIIIVSLKDMVLGVIIDSISKVIGLDEASILPPPSVVSGIGREYITGVGRVKTDELIILLDINKLLSFEELTLLGKNT